MQMGSQIAITMNSTNLGHGGGLLAGSLKLLVLGQYDNFRLGGAIAQLQQDLTILLDSCVPWTDWINDLHNQRP